MPYPLAQCENACVPTSLFRFVQDAATEAGFEHAGVAPASDPEMRELEYFSDWVDAGYAGEMEYLKRRSDSGEYKRSSLEQALPWAKSVVVVAMNYNPPAPKSTEPAAGRSLPMNLGGARLRRALISFCLSEIRARRSLAPPFMRKLTMKGKSWRTKRPIT